MKLLLLLSVFCVSCVTYPPYPEAKIYECPGEGKAQIMKKIEEYFSTNFTQGKECIQYNNFQEGRMVFQGKIDTIHNLGFVVCITRFTMTIYIKDNKIRIEYNNMTGANHVDCNYNSWSQAKIDEQLSRLEKDLITYISNDKPKNW